MVRSVVVVVRQAGDPRVVVEEDQVLAQQDYRAPLPSFAGVIWTEEAVEGVWESRFLRGLLIQKQVGPGEPVGGSAGAVEAQRGGEAQELSQVPRPHRHQEHLYQERVRFHEVSGRYLKTTE